MEKWNYYQMIQEDLLKIIKFKTVSWIAGSKFVLYSRHKISSWKTVENFKIFESEKEEKKLNEMRSEVKT